MDQGLQTDVEGGRRGHGRRRGCLLYTSYKVVHFAPFDPVGKRTEATVKGPDGATFKVTKGAPQVVLALSGNAGHVKASVDKAVNGFAARGFRSLGVARAEGDGAWQFIGVLPLFDPPRKDAKATIATAVQMLSLIHIYCIFVGAACCSS